MSPQRNHDTSGHEPDAERREPPSSQRSPAPTPVLAGSSHQVDLVTASQLAQFLGASTDALPAEIADTDVDLLGVQLDLGPGDVLYRQGCISHYVYILQSGLVQCHSQHGGLGLPMAISYAGAQQWVGLHDRAGRRQESVEAAVQTSLLAFPVSELRTLATTSPLMAELLAQRINLAQARDQRMLGSLRALQPEARTAAGLAQLARLMSPHPEAEPPDALIQASISIDLLSDWLGLSVRELIHSLLHLHHAGAVSIDATHITELSPRALFREPSVARFMAEQAPPNSATTLDSKPAWPWQKTR